MRNWMRKLAIVVALGLAAPAWAGSTAADAKDTATQKKAEARKTARKAKPGKETRSDRMADAKDTAKATGAKAKRQGRKATARTKKAAKNTRDWAKEKTTDQGTTK